MTAPELLRHGIAAALILAGVIGALVAAAGALRFCDVFERTHALRAGAVCAPLTLAGLAVEAFDVALAVRLAALAAVLALTGPAIAHLITQAAHRGGVTPAQRAKAPAARRP